MPSRIPLGSASPDGIEEAFRSLGLGADDVDLVVCTDAEEILGIGDWGVGGIQISIGKIAVYTAAAGVDPRRVVAVSLDVGTDNETLLNDPLYVGNRHSRRRDRGYDKFIDAYLSTAARMFPKARLHFEDLGPENAHRILQDVVEAMAASTERPIIFPLSNPTSRIESMPADILPWSNGRTLIATGIPVDPVELEGVRHTIGQANNALLYPGLGFGTIVSGARRVTPGMLLAAAEAVAAQVDVREPGAALLPPISDLRASSATVAVAVVKAAQADGVATVTSDDTVQSVLDAMWQPTYEGVVE